MTETDLEKSLQATGQPWRGAKLPPRDAVFTADASIICDQYNRLRCEYRGKSWSSKENDYVPHEEIAVFDGKRRKRLFLRGIQPFPNAHLKTEDAAHVARHIRLLPIRLAFRPLDQEIGVFASGSLSASLATGFFEQRKCLVVKHSNGSIWVDPARAYIPVRYEEARSGKVVRCITMSYKGDDKSGWNPSSWHSVRLSPQGEIVDSITATVTESKLNDIIADRTFEIDFPPGTWVRDYDTDERYILRDGRSRRPILPGEYDGTNYETLLNTDPPSGLSPAVWVLIGTGLVIVLLVVAVAWYRRWLRHA